MDNIILIREQVIFISTDFNILDSKFKWRNIRLYISQCSIKFTNRYQSRLIAKYFRNSLFLSFNIFMIQYNPKDWFYALFTLHKADTFRALIPMLIFLYFTHGVWYIWKPNIWNLPKIIWCVTLPLCIHFWDLLFPCC